MPNRVAIVGCLDTKGDEILFIKGTLEEEGCSVHVIDTGVMGEPVFEAETTREKVAEAADASLVELRKGGDRGVAMETMARGATKVLRQLYAPFLRTDKPFLVMSPESAEMTKYAANALLATKISFINNIANICERFDADINDVRRGIGHDSRIGFAFLFPGVGYGGSCFPKDVRALISTSKDVGLEPRMFEAVDWMNEQQKLVMQQKIEQHFNGNLAGKTIAVWGLAFKPCTDDIREAPALVLIEHLISSGAKVQAYDPEAMKNVTAELGDKITLTEQAMDALDGADALAIMTEWTQFRTPDFQEVRQRLARPVIFDGRNLYNPQTVADAGFTYHSIGRPTARPAGKY